MRNIYKYQFLLTLALCVVSCDISEEIPYPVVQGQITEFVVNGQCTEEEQPTEFAAIDKNTRTITLNVVDTVNLANLRIRKISLAGTTYNPDVDYKEMPALFPDSAMCLNFARFPKTAFDATKDNRDFRMDFTNDVRFVVRTYQDYEWTVKVNQIVERMVEVENQVGMPIIDVDNRNVLIYVNRSQSLKNIKVKKFVLGGRHGAVSPDPTTEETFDFYNMRKFAVMTGWGELQEWKVMVFQTDAKVEPTVNVLARNHTATIYGDKPNDVIPKIEYKESASFDWKSVTEADLEMTSTSYTATIKGLRPSMQYQYRVSFGDDALHTEEFNTVALQQLPNASFDEWHTDASNPKLFCPWAQGGTSFWDTGNRGATIVGSSNSIPTDDTSTGSGRAAYLESKYIVIKFAAGNIFTGKYLKTDGTNGVLGFGHPFTAFPNKLTFDYKYKSAPITKCGDKSYEYLLGRPDSCNVYVALWHIGDGDFEEYQGEKYPVVIRTEPGANQNLFNPNDPRVIAYGQFTQGNTVENWTTETINIKYKNTMVEPTHILVVASSSKFGDFFTGGVGSTMVLDNMKLIYE
jgi:hypothetical protein